MTLTPARAASLGNHLYRNVQELATESWLGLLNSSLTELTGNGYERVHFTPALPAFDVTTGESSNTSISFPTAIADWTEAHYVAFYPTSAGGDYFQLAQIGTTTGGVFTATPIIVTSGHFLKFPAASIIIGP